VHIRLGQELQETARKPRGATSEASLFLMAYYARTSVKHKHDEEIVMSKALVLGAAALLFSAASASAQVYAEPVADLAVPADGYAAP
jgi:hypothetical protein